MGALIVIVGLIFGCGQHVTSAVGSMSPPVVKRHSAPGRTGPAQPAPLKYVVPTDKLVRGQAKVKGPTQAKEASPAGIASQPQRPLVDRQPCTVPVVRDGSRPLVKRPRPKQQRRRWVPERVPRQPYGGVGGIY